MKTRTLPRLLALTLVAFGLAIGAAAPASATIRNNTSHMESGRVTVTGFVSQTFDTPAANPSACSAGLNINSSIDDTKPTTNNMSATLTIDSVFEFPTGSGTYYQLLATASSPGYVGDYVISTGVFTGLTQTGTFTLKSYNSVTCTPIATLCGGNVSLTASGQSLSTTLPWPVGTNVKVNANGTISSVTPSCPFPFNLIVRNGATISLGDNPNDCYLNGGTPPACTPGGPDNAAIFEVTV